MIIGIYIWIKIDPLVFQKGEAKKSPLRVQKCNQSLAHICPSCGAFVCVTLPRRGQYPQGTLSSSKRTGDADARRRYPPWYQLVTIWNRARQVQTFSTKQENAPCRRVPMTQWEDWGLEFFSGVVGWLVKADPWVISQQEPAVCSPWTHLWEQQACDMLSPKF